MSFMANYTLYDLEKRVTERAAASADVSYTRKLIDKGVAHCAKKLGEEAVEVAIAAVATVKGQRRSVFTPAPASAPGAGRAAAGTG